MLWLPDVRQSDYEELKQVHAPRVAEIVAVHWPELDGIKYYCSTAADEIFVGSAASNPTIQPLEIRFKQNQFLDLPIEDGVSDSQIKLEFWDADGAISDLHLRHGAGVRVVVYYWFPDFGYFLEQWHGHLGEPEEEDGEMFSVPVAYGFRSALQPLPRRYPKYSGCQAVWGGLLSTLDEIAHNDCPWNLHLPGGTTGVAGSELLGECPRQTRQNCTDYLGDSDSFLAFDTPADSYPNANLISKTRGTGRQVKDTLPVVYGPFTLKECKLLGFAIDENTNDPDQGWVWCLFGVSEGVVEYIEEPYINNKFDGLEHFRYALGELRQARTDPPFSPSAGNYSGTAYFVMRVSGDYRFTDGEDLSGQCHVGRRMNVPQWTDTETRTEGPSNNRAWVLLDVMTNKRWGHGIDESRLVIQDWIDIAAWCDELVDYKDASGATQTSIRSQFVGALTEKSAARHIYDICLAGNFTLPFPYRGKTRIFGLSAMENLELAPVFTDEGEERNIVVDEKGKSLLKTFKTSDRELANRVVVTFADRELDNETRTLVFEDVTQQLKAGKTFGDKSRRQVTKDYNLVGVDGIGAATRLGNMLLDLGPLAGTTDDGAGLENNRRVKFTTWFSYTLNLHKYGVIKVISKKIAKYGFTYFRIVSMTRLADLKVEIEAVAYPERYYETSNTLMLATSSLIDGQEGTAYTQSLAAAGGVGPYSYAVTDGSLPDGLTLSSATISGTPSTPGTYSFDITVTDSGGRSATMAYTITIASAPVTGTDTGLSFEVTDASLPISIGLPVSEGENLTNATNLQLRNASDVLVSCSFAARERWHGLASDTSKKIKVLALDFTPNGTGVYTVETGTSNPSPASAISLTNNTNDYHVQVGDLDLKIGKNGNNPLVSCKLSTVEQLSGTLPTITATVPVKSRLVANSTSVSGNTAAAIGQNFVTPAAPGLFTGVTSVKFGWEGKYTGLVNGVPKAITYTTENPIEIGRDEFSPDHKFIFDQGGADEYILTLYDYVWKTGYFARATTLADGTGTPLDTFPSGMPLNVTVRDKEAIDAGTYTVDSISSGRINLTTTLSKRLLKNIIVEPATTTSPVTATLEMQSASVSLQNAHRLIIKQVGFFKYSGSRLFPDLQVELYWEFFAGHSFTKCEMRVVNANQTMPAVVDDAQWEALQFNLPLGVTGTASSDEVLANNGSGSACARRTAGTSDSTAVAGSFKWCIANLAEKWPSRLVATTSAFTWSPYPAISGTTHAFPKDRANLWQFTLGASADSAAKIFRDLRVKYNAAYVASSGVIRRMFSAPKSWVTNDWQGDSRAADAANRFERQLKMQWDETANDVGASLQWSHFNRELSSHTHPDSGNDFGDVFGVNLFGTTFDQGDNYTGNRYDFVEWMLIEGIRNGNAKAWRMALEHANNQFTLGTILSAIPNGSNETYNKLGGHRYEKSTNGINNTDYDGYYTHHWVEGLYLCWALTGAPWMYDTLLLSRDYARRGIDSGLAATFETYNEGRGLGWLILALLAAYRHFGDTADLTRAVAAADALRSFEESQGLKGVYVATGYTSPSSSRGKQVFNSELCGYAAFGLVELLAELEAKGTPNATLQNALIRGAKWAARGLASLNNAQGNQPVIAAQISGGNITPAIGRYEWFQSGIRLSDDDSMIVGALTAVGLLAAARAGNFADLKALAWDCFKAANLYQDSDVRTARPIGTYDTLSYRRSQYYASSDKVHRQTMFLGFPFLADQLKNQSLNPPTITTVAPSSIAANASVTLTITGTGFVTGCQVGIGGYVFTPASVTATQIVLTIAANLYTAGKYPVMVSNPNKGQSNLASVTVT